VNLDSVERFTTNSLVMSGGYILPIAQRRQKETRRRIMDCYNNNVNANYGNYGNYVADVGALAEGC
jgi:hypothetical protein